MAAVLDPSAFIQPIEHRPKPTSNLEAEGIPLIDLSALNSSDSNAIASLVAKIGDACEKWGFFQVINHGVPVECRENVDSVSRKFFRQSKEEKSRVRRDELNPMGYYDGEHTKNVRDWKEVFDFVVQVPTVIPASPEPGDEELTKLHNQWPEFPTNFSLVAKIGDACENWGFFQVINHGVPVECRENVDSVSRKFFRQSKEEKGRVRRDELNPMGYYDGEHTKNVRDWKEVFDFVVQVPTVIPASPEPGDKELTKLHNQWPEFPTNFRDACEEYTREIEKLCYKLLELISLSLGLPANRFQNLFKDQTSFLRLNYYPPCPIPHLALGVGHHKDAGGLTVLSQDDVGGLEVKRKSDGEWVRVKPTPGAYIVNVADIIQVWSNDKYESVEHRVMTNSERERFSIPFFFNPAHYTVVEPVAELVNEENPAKYKPFNWGKFVSARNLSNFKKLHVENIQIYHFKKSE